MTEKKIYQMTQKEYITSMGGKRIKHEYFSRLGQLIYNHQNEVEWAVQLGKDVSEEVLKDYPEILRKYFKS
ncbi:MAG: hypothetical protein PHU53_07700 [Thermoplasmata archaeon]|nr:hypothetical protein [Thermoplasmata archaeon]